MTLKGNDEVRHVVLVSALPKSSFIRPQDYLALERNAEEKSEYLNGIVVAHVRGQASAQSRGR